MPSPKDAATLILTRDGTAGLEVLLLERHPASRFAPGAFAFPGGRIEADDAPSDAARFCCGLTATDAAQALRDVSPPGRALGFWVAGIREAFEEVGLLLAYERTGEPLRLEGEPGARFAAHRQDCRRDPRAFWRMVRDEQLLLATDRLAYFAHWITPEERAIRYDTRFFVAATLPGQVPDPDGVEVVSWRWLAPRQALALHRERRLLLPFPTMKSLEVLEGFDGLAPLLAAVRRREVRAVRPRLIVEDGEERLLLPGDPGYY
ncbi:MAG: NUDIX domain-containing protein [Candidatus Rokubacteria bacterium]|nr:NUDIX domain-containing protein [Candidatus Rokubacteria bacterium]